MVLSDDEEWDEEMEFDEDEEGGLGAGRKRNRKGHSKRAQVAAGGTKRNAAVLPPIPLAFQEVEGGFQEYKHPGQLRVYQQRNYTYDEQHKIGGVRTDRPPPPTLFPDNIKWLARSSLKEPEKNFGKLLQWRTEARIVRQSFHNFVDMPLDKAGPADDGVPPSRNP